jgi:hypothetical protein
MRGLRRARAWCAAAGGGLRLGDVEAAQLEAVPALLRPALPARTACDRPPCTVCCGLQMWTVLGCIAPAGVVVEVGGFGPTWQLGSRVPSAGVRPRARSGQELPLLVNKPMRCVVRPHLLSPARAHNCLRPTLCACAGPRLCWAATWSAFCLCLLRRCRSRCCRQLAARWWC